MSSRRRRRMRSRQTSTQGPDAAVPAPRPSSEVPCPLPPSSGGIAATRKGEAPQQHPGHHDGVCGAAAPISDRSTAPATATPLASLFRQVYTAVLRRLDLANVLAVLALGVGLIALAQQCGQDRIANAGTLLLTYELLPASESRFDEQYPALCIQNAGPGVVEITASSVFMDGDPLGEWNLDTVREIRRRVVDPGANIAFQRSPLAGKVYPPGRSDPLIYFEPNEWGSMTRQKFDVQLDRVRITVEYKAQDGTSQRCTYPSN